MAVDHRGDIGAGAVDLAMDEALQIDRAATRRQGIAVKVELQDVVRGDEGGRQIPGQEKPVGRLVVANADMAEGIDDTVVEEDVRLAMTSSSTSAASAAAAGSPRSAAVSATGSDIVAALSSLPVHMLNLLRCGSRAVLPRRRASFDSVLSYG